VTIKQSTFRAASAQSTMGPRIARHVLLTDYVPGAQTVVPSVVTPPSAPNEVNAGEDVTGTGGTYAGQPAPSLVRRYWELRLDSGLWVELNGTDSLTLSTSSGQAGKQVRLNEVYSNGIDPDVTGTSDPVDVVVGAQAPAFIVDPVISGEAKEGQTLSVSDGSVTGTTPITYAYQWKRDGVALSGATLSTYVVQYEDVGAQLTCTVTAENGAGSDDATSAPTASVRQAPELLFDEYWDYQDLEDQGYVDGDGITSWLGRNLGIDGTSTGSARYTYRADAGGVPGAAEADGVDDKIEIDAIASWFNPGETYTVAMAHSDMTAGSSSYRYMWSAGNDDSGTWVSAYARFNNHYPFIRRAGATVDTFFGVDPADDWTVIEVVEGPTGSGARSVDIAAWVSPDEVTPIVTQSGSSSVETAMTTFTLGCRRISGGTSLGFFFEGDLRGFGVKRAEMTVTELTRWERYCDDMNWTCGGKEDDPT
jgi:hypothetical protein